MNAQELIDGGEALKKWHAEHIPKAIDAAIAMAIRLRNGDPDASEDIMCQHADVIGEAFRFDLLDFVRDRT